MSDEKVEMKTEFTINGKTFKYPARVTNGRVIEVAELADNPTKVAWYLSRQDLEKMMPLLLEGPHDEIDWLDVDQVDTVGVYNGFFGYCAWRVTKSES
jgi:hypothetical protein